MSALIEIQLKVLLAQDAQGRLTATRDPTPGPAPRLFLGRSKEGNVWAVRSEVDPQTTRELDRLCASEPKLAAPCAEQHPKCRDSVCELLAPVQSEWRGPAFVLPKELPHDDRAREMTAEESSQCFQAFPWLATEFNALAPVVIAFQDGQPATICHSPRGCTAFAAEAGVETLEGFRGQGLATAAVACWARAIQRRGLIALYSTSWETAASRAIANRLSARLYGENWYLA